MLNEKQIELLQEYRKAHPDEYITWVFVDLPVSRVTPIARKLASRYHRDVDYRVLETNDESKLCFFITPNLDHYNKLITLAWPCVKSLCRNDTFFKKNYNSITLMDINGNEFSVGQIPLGKIEVKETKYLQNIQKDAKILKNTSIRTKYKDDGSCELYAYYNIPEELYHKTGEVISIVNNGLKKEKHEFKRVFKGLDYSLLDFSGAPQPKEIQQEKI